MSPRAAVLVAVVVAVLAVVALGMGFGQDEGGVDDSNALLDLLGGLAEPATVPRDQIRASCADADDPTRLRFGDPAGDCTLEVERDSGLGLVRLVPGSDIRIDAPAPQGDVEGTFEAEPDADDPDGEVTVAVDEGSTTIVLRCQQVGGCTARLVE